MFAKLKSPVFIDSVVFEFTQPAIDYLRAVLKDDKGSICSSLDTTVPFGLTNYRWNGLNDLPYGVYTLEFSQGRENHKVRMVKRV